MKIAALIASILLGGLFVFSASVVLFGTVPTPELPKDTPIWHFMQAFAPTGYMTMVKVLELVGGVLLMLPKTRNIGLLILGPIVLNILAFHHFVAKDGVLQPMLIGIAALSLFILWTERKAFSGLIK